MPDPFLERRESREDDRDDEPDSEAGLSGIAPRPSPYLDPT